MTLTIDLLDQLSMWRPFEFAAQPTPTAASTGSGSKRWALHWEMMARRRQIEMEDEEILALLGHAR